MSGPKRESVLEVLVYLKGRAGDFEKRLKMLEALHPRKCRTCYFYSEYDGCELSESCKTEEREQWTEPL